MDLLQIILQWINEHPTWSGVVVFMIACSESLAVIGLFMPGAILMFGIGTVIASGSMPLASTLVWAIAGAFCGDGISFWLGRHYRDALYGLWPLSRHPGLMARATNFFHKHGIKSIIMARFIGPLRPVVPAIVGMAQMPARTFFLINGLSALFWAPAYIIPGLVFGASLELASEVAGRLASFILIVLLLLWLSLWLVRYLARWIHTEFRAPLEKVIDWSNNHPLIKPIINSIIDPDYSVAPGLFFLTTIYLSIFGLIALITHKTLQVGTGGIDLAIFYYLQGLHMPLTDQLMVMISGLGERALLESILAITILLLIWQRRWRASIYLGCVYLGTMSMTYLLKATLEIPRPLSGAYEGISNYAFPSAHTSLSTAVYGFIALLITKELAYRHHWIPYSLATILVSLIGLSRVYLGVHWFSDVIGGLVLALIWILIFDISYRCRHTPRITTYSLGLPALLFIGLFSIHHYQQLDQGLQRYTQKTQAQSLTTDKWIQTDWLQLDTQRVDLEGYNYPINIQWHARLEVIEGLLTQQGWHRSSGFTLESMMKAFGPEPAPHNLAVLPQTHNSSYESLLLTRQGSNTENQFVLRLWPTSIIINQQEDVFWTGTVSLQKKRTLLGLYTYLKTSKEFNSPLDQLRATLIKTQTSYMERQIQTSTAYDWDGKVLLIDLMEKTP